MSGDFVFGSDSQEPTSCVKSPLTFHTRHRRSLCPPRRSRSLWGALSVMGRKATKRGFIFAGCTWATQSRVAVKREGLLAGHCHYFWARSQTDGRMDGARGTQQMSVGKLVSRVKQKTSGCDVREMPTLMWKVHTWRHNCSLTLRWKLYPGSYGNGQNGELIDVSWAYSHETKTGTKWSLFSLNSSPICPSGDNITKTCAQFWQNEMIFSKNIDGMLQIWESNHKCIKLVQYSIAI